MYMQYVQIFANSKNLYIFSLSFAYSGQEEPVKELTCPACKVGHLILEGVEYPAGKVGQPSNTNSPLTFGTVRYTIGQFCSKGTVQSKLRGIESCFN